MTRLSLLRQLLLLIARALRAVFISCQVICYSRRLYTNAYILRKGAINDWN